MRQSDDRDRALTSAAGILTLASGRVDDWPRVATDYLRSAIVNLAGQCGLTLYELEARTVELVGRAQRTPVDGASMVADRFRYGRPERIEGPWEDPARLAAQIMTVLCSHCDDETKHTATLDRIGKELDRLTLET